MPRLIEYVSFGFCSSYGDGDYRISMTVADLSAEQMQELRATAVGALYAMEEIWRKAHPLPMGGQSENKP